MKKYKTEQYGIDKIIAIEVDRESEHSVWIGKRRHNKKSDYTNFFDTWKEAHALLLERANHKVEHAQRNLASAVKDAHDVMGMTESEIEASDG